MMGSKQRNGLNIHQSKHKKSPYHVKQMREDYTISFRHASLVLNMRSNSGRGEQSGHDKLLDQQTEFDAQW